MKNSTLLLKITHGEVYSFFSSNDLTEFSLGSRACQAVIRAPYVEPKHIGFAYVNNVWTAVDTSAAGNVRLGRRILGKKSAKIKDDDILSIFPPKGNGKKPSVTIEVVKNIHRKFDANKMTAFKLNNKREYMLGRDESCDLVVNNPLVEKKHCRIVYDDNACYIEDLHTISGTFVNNRKIKTAKLTNYDRISVAGAAYIFYDFALLTSKSANGIEISAKNVEREVPDVTNRLKTVQLLDRVSFTVAAGEFVAIVGGSGAGKSTLMDCLTGVRPASAGKILYDGNDYYENINSYRGVVGVVPQRDVLHDDLTVEKGLYYTARMRVRAAIGKEELLKKVAEAIADVKLTGKEKLKINKLSGGQKKRVSIAMELLADPKVIFLDEPTSGLSPDLDLELMDLLKELAAKGRTIIVITHAMDNVDKCDKIAFLGRGGRLCYYNNPEYVFGYFAANTYSKIFAEISKEDKAIKFADKYRKTLPADAEEVTNE